MRIKFSDELTDDIMYLIDECGCEDAREALREIIQDSDDPDHWASKHRNEVRSLCRSLGVDIEVTSAMQLTTLGGSGRDRTYRKGGKRWMFDSWAPLDRATVAAGGILES